MIQRFAWFLGVLAVTNATFLKQRVQGVTLLARNYVSPTYAAYDYVFPKATLKTVNATHVRFVETWFVKSVDDTSPYPRYGTKDLENATKIAKNMGLEVMLACEVAPDREILAMQDASNPDVPGYVGRSTVGEMVGFVDGVRPFFVDHCTELGETIGASVLEIGPGLERAWEHDGWEAVFAEIRKKFLGTVIATFPSSWFANVNGSIPSWVEHSPSLDAVGATLWPALPSVSDEIPSSDMIANALGVYVKGLEEFGKEVLVTEAGFQSKYVCAMRPNATFGPHILDCASWPDCYSMSCQWNGYRAILDRIPSLVVFGLTTDPTQGGTSDFGFSFHGKPAQALLASEWGAPCHSEMEEEVWSWNAWRSRWAHSVFEEVSPQNYPSGIPPQNYPSGIPPQNYPSVSIRRGYDPTSDLPMVPHQKTTLQDSTCDGSALVAEAVKSQNGHGVGNQSRLNGFNFGIGQWSYPGFAAKSNQTLASLTAMRDAGASTAQIIVSWYVDSVNSTTIYPEMNVSSPYFTTPDDELEWVIQTAMDLGLRVSLSPLLELNRFAPQGCWRDPGCPWRGEIGEHFGTNCSDDSLWGKWWASYKPIIVHYAHMANKLNVTAYLVHHELLAASRACPGRWEDLIHTTRTILQPSTLLTLAANHPVLELDPILPWMRQLDMIGLDAYFQYSSTWTQFLNHTFGPHYYNDTPQSTLDAAMNLYNQSLHNFLKWSGVPLVITENGFPSRPFGYDGNAYQINGASDCHEWALCDYNSAPRAYKAFCRLVSQSLGSQDMLGILWWIWHADYTAGGTFDSTKTPAGKYATLQEFRLCDHPH